MPQIHIILHAMFKKFKKHKKHIVRFLPAAIFAYLFFLLSKDTVSGSFQEMNNYLNLYFSEKQTPLLNQIMLGITYTMNTLPAIILSAILGLCLLLQKKWKNFFLATFALGFGALSKILIKQLTAISRPTSELIHRTDFSYPSGHATIATIFFSLIIYFFKDKIKNRLLKISFIALNILLILVISFSRIYLNAHWFSDVLGGLAWGLFWIFLTIGIAKYFKTTDQS